MCRVYQWHFVCTIYCFCHTSCLLKLVHISCLVFLVQHWGLRCKKTEDGGATSRTEMHNTEDSGAQDWRRRCTRFFTKLPNFVLWSVSLYSDMHNTVNSSPQSCTLHSLTWISVTNAPCNNMEYGESLFSSVGVTLQALKGQSWKILLCAGSLCNTALCREFLEHCTAPEICSFLLPSVRFQ